MAFRMWITYSHRRDLIFHYHRIHQKRGDNRVIDITIFYLLLFRTWLTLDIRLVFFSLPFHKRDRLSVLFILSFYFGSGGYLLFRCYSLFSYTTLRIDFYLAFFFVFISLGGYDIMEKVRDRLI